MPAFLHNTGAEPLAAPWPDDLARERAERDRVASTSAASEREATALLRQALVHALLGWEPSPMTAAQLARYLEPRGVPHGDLAPHLAAIVELGLAFETTCLVGRDRVPGWAVVPDLRERVSERGVAVLVAEG